LSRGQSLLASKSFGGCCFGAKPAGVHWGTFPGFPFTPSEYSGAAPQGAIYMGDNLSAGKREKAAFGKLLGTSHVNAGNWITDQTRSTTPHDRRSFKNQIVQVIGRPRAAQSTMIAAPDCV